MRNPSRILRIGTQTVAYSAPTIADGAPFFLYETFGYRFALLTAGSADLFLAATEFVAVFKTSLAGTVLCLDGGALTTGLPFISAGSAGAKSSGWVALAPAAYSMPCGVYITAYVRGGDDATTVRARYTMLHLAEAIP